ncbi:MAG: trigger factor family protein, partial [Ignavibacteriae bacterium]
MECKITAPDGTRRTVTIELTKDELKPHYDEAYQRAQTSITLPGFRKGKVPVNIIKQRLGREIENEALETIADSEFRKYAKSEQLKVVGNPALTDVRKSQDGVGFTIEFEVMPEFELGNYRDLNVNRP